MDANTRGVTVWRRALNREHRQLFLCAAKAQSQLYSPYTNSTYSALLVPRWLLASQRYVPLSVLFSVVMVSSLPSTIMRSMSGSSPPSLDHSTGSGLETENIRVFLTVERYTSLKTKLATALRFTSWIHVNLHWVTYGNALQFQVLSLLWNNQWMCDLQMGSVCRKKQRKHWEFCVSEASAVLTKYKSSSFPIV